MNPFLQRVMPKTVTRINNYSLDSIIQDVKNGKLDAKQKSLELLSQMSPSQKSKIKSMLPRFEALAKKTGIQENVLKSFMRDIQSRV